MNDWTKLEPDWVYTGSRPRDYSISIDVDRGETVVCPNCNGSGDDPDTMICVMCGGDGVLRDDDMMENAE